MSKIKYELNVVEYGESYAWTEYNESEITDKLLLDIADEYKKLKDKETLELWLECDGICTKYLVSDCIDFVHMLDAKNYIKINPVFKSINNKLIPIITDESIEDTIDHGLSLKLLEIYVDPNYKEEEKENE